MCNNKNTVCESCLNNELYINDLQDLNDRQARFIDQILDAVDTMSNYLVVLEPGAGMEEDEEEVVDNTDYGDEGDEDWYDDEEDDD